MHLEEMFLMIFLKKRNVSRKRFHTSFIQKEVHNMTAIFHFQSLEFCSLIPKLFCSRIPYFFKVGDESHTKYTASSFM